MGLLRLVGGESDMRDVAGVGPFGCDMLGALRRFAVQQHHVWVLGVDLIELGPDQTVVVEVEPAGEGDLRTGREQHLISARFLAARKSRLSIIAEVRLRWLNIDPLRGRQFDPGWRSYGFVAWSRIS